jgi:hypothetical protein
MPVRAGRDAGATPIALTEAGLSRTGLRAGSVTTGIRGIELAEMPVPFLAPAEMPALLFALAEMPEVAINENGMDTKTTKGRVPLRFIFGLGAG